LLAKDDWQMKLISIESARTTWLFPVEEFKPLGGTDGKKIIDAITVRYGFSHPPGNPTREEIEKSGLKFAGGHLRSNDELVNIVEFTVFNDGIVASATTTEGAEAFLNEIYKFLTSTFDFRAITSHIKKIHISIVIVEFEVSLSVALRGHDRIFDSVKKHLNLAEQTEHPTELTRMDFTLDKDPEFRPPNLPRLTIEKRANTPFAQHRYFSSAPLMTGQHVNLLEQIEIDLLGRPASLN
jgi:hypothetical protein